MGYRSQSVERLTGLLLEPRNTGTSRGRDNHGSSYYYFIYRNV